MDEKASAYIWPEELTLQMLEVRFNNDRLFKIKKQPWREFYKILLANGFPRDVTVKQVTKKWGYLWSMYKIAKRENDKSWKYYDMFDKNFSKSKELGKYESWSNEWRLKLITCITAAREPDMDLKTMWRTVERALRSQELPEDCCINDMQGLWHHLKATFIRLHRIITKKGSEHSKWPLYDAMLGYYKTHESLAALENEPCMNISRKKKNKLLLNKKRRDVNDNGNEQEFVWNKDMTESLIQIRLQNDSLFNQKGHPWKHFVKILKEEYGFPEQVKSKDVGKKWQSIYAEYQKAKSTNHTSWLYYNIFEVYLGEGPFSINPLFDWQEQWALKLIEARTSLEEFFMQSKNKPRRVDYRRNASQCWREVEKKLRRDGIPLDHSMLDLDNIWVYLIRTYKTKKKYADKGVLKEQWPYFTEMAKYMEIHEKSLIKEKEIENIVEYDVPMMNDDDDEDDIKLFDLKQKLELKEMKHKELRLEGKQCRACANVSECVDIFERIDDDNIASKLALIAGIQVEKSDKLPPQICYNCLQELENAYKFRRKCQMIDEQFRDSSINIKVEVLDKIDDDVVNNDAANDNDNIDNDYSQIDDTTEVPKPPNTKYKPKKKYKRYDYYQVCEICGMHTKNLKSHVDKHNVERPYSCEVCGKKFKFKNAAVVHRHVHETVPKKTCEVCGKTFNNMAYYKKHFVYHANERKFACDTCGRRFNSLDILKVHMLIHTGERPFVCSECGKTFRTAGCVARHRRIVHKILIKKTQ